MSILHELVIVKANSQKNSDRSNESMKMLKSLNTELKRICMLQTHQLAKNICMTFFQ